MVVSFLVNVEFVFEVTLATASQVIQCRLLVALGAVAILVELQTAKR
jgi:hypothetical protein